MDDWFQKYPALLWAFRIFNAIGLIGCCWLLWNWWHDKRKKP